MLVLKIDEGMNNALPLCLCGCRLLWVTATSCWTPTTKPTNCLMGSTAPREWDRPDRTPETPSPCESSDASVTQHRHYVPLWKAHWWTRSMMSVREHAAVRWKALRCVGAEKPLHTARIARVGHKPGSFLVSLRRKTNTGVHLKNVKKSHWLKSTVGHLSVAAVYICSCGTETPAVLNPILTPWT